MEHRGTGVNGTKDSVPELLYLTANGKSELGAKQNIARGNITRERMADYRKTGSALSRRDQCSAQEL